MCGLRGAGPGSQGPPGQGVAQVLTGALEQVIVCKVQVEVERSGGVGSSLLRRYSNV